MSSPPRILLVANPENRRAQFFREACARLGLEEPRVLPWIEALQSGRDLKKDLRGIDLVRLDSPGENFEVERALIARGCERLGKQARLTAKEAERLTASHGELRLQPEWYAGWESVLEAWGTALCGCNTRVMNDPQEIAWMFDKWGSQVTLAAVGVPVPEDLGCPRNYDQVLALMDRAGARRVFIKPRHSSSASGVIAFQRSGNHQLATTSVELDTSGGEVRLFNSLRMRRYQDPDEIRTLIDALGGEALMMERWFPKASIDGRAFDLRVLVIAGEPTHIVVRTSQTPITNLHLGNERGSVEQVRERLGEAAWNEGMDVCRQAAACFPRSHYVAVDLMVGSQFNQFAVAEVNAFGDLLPRVEWNGMDTYTAELSRFLTSAGHPVR